MTALSAQSSVGSALWTADQFLDFCMTRPDEERWQLVDGLAMMMVPPTKVHQRIGKNLARLLDDALEVVRPELAAYQEIGVRVPGIVDFNAIPDVVAVEAEASYDRYVEAFLLVAEVISPSNTAEMIERKVDNYCRHPGNLYVLSLDQDSVEVILRARDAKWEPVELRSLRDTLKLPAFGLEALLSEIYAYTPLVR